MTSKDRYSRSRRLLAQLAQFKAECENGQKFKLEAAEIGKPYTPAIGKLINPKTKNLRA